MSIYLYIIFFVGFLFSFDVFPQRRVFSITHRSETTAVANVNRMTKFLRKWMDTDLPYVTAPAEFCPQGAATAVETDYVDVIVEPVSSFKSLLAVASLHNRKTGNGRKNCRKAISNWYLENSMWSHLNDRERIESTFTILEEQQKQLGEELDIRFHSDFNIGIVMCIGRRETNVYPETINRNVCNRRCNNNLRGVPSNLETLTFDRPGQNCVQSRNQKHLAHGLGQIMPNSFWGGFDTLEKGYGRRIGYTGTDETPDNSKKFINLGERPEIQMAMKIYQLNEYMNMRERLRRLHIFNYEGASCVKINSESEEIWALAVARYDQQDCTPYVTKVKKCMRRCFWGKTREQSIDCLLENDKTY